MLLSPVNIGISDVARRYPAGDGRFECETRRVFGKKDIGLVERHRVAR